MDDAVWDIGYLFDRRVIQDEVVIGMFGDVKETDIHHLSKLLTALHIIAPDLKISYSNNMNGLNNGTLANIKRINYQLVIYHQIIYILTTLI